MFVKRFDSGIGFCETTLLNEAPSTALVHLKVGFQYVGHLDLVRCACLSSDKINKIEAASCHQPLFDFEVHQRRETHIASITYDHQIKIISVE